MPDFPLDFDTRNRLHRYFDPPLYILLAGAVFFAVLANLALISAPVLTLATYLVLGPTVDLPIAGWLLSGGFAAAATAVAMVVFFALQERARPHHREADELIDSLEPRVLDAARLLTELGLAPEDLIQPPITYGQPFFDKLHGRQPRVRRGAESRPRASMRRAHLVALTDRALHVYDCIYDLLTWTTLEVRVHEVAYENVIGSRSIEASRIHHLRGVFSNTISVPDHRIELMLSGGEIISFPLPVHDAVNRDSETVEPPEIVLALRRVARLFPESNPAREDRPGAVSS